MSGSSHTTRRRLLTTVGVGVCGVLAGCNGDDGSGTPGTSTDSPSSTTGDELAFDHPDTVQSDEPFDITVTGLLPDESVEVVLSGEDGDGDEFEGRATVEAGGETLSLADATVASETEALNGVVPSGVDVPLPMALFQFASPMTFGQYDWPSEQELTYSIRQDGETLGETTVSREYPDRSEFVVPDHPELEGVLFEPTDSVRGPGVVLLHGSGASSLRGAAAILASRDYTVLSLQYLRGEGLPANPVEVPIEYVRDAAEWLRDYRTTSSEQVGLFGFSLGGELALLAGSAFDIFDPVISVNGSGLVWEGYTFSEDSGLQFSDASRWTRDGEPVPYADVDPDRQHDHPSVYAAPAALADETVEEASIPVENIDGRVVLISGAEDFRRPSAELHAVAADRLEEHDHQAYEHLVYEDAGHFITPPYNPVVGLTQRGSATYEGMAEANHDHWQAVLDALSTRL